MDNSCIVTKGDASPAPDPPVPRGLVRGVGVFVVPHWLWIPLFIFSAGSSLISIARTRVVGIASAVTYATILLFIMAIYTLAQPPPGYTKVELPALYLSNIHLDNRGCRIVVRYVGDLAIANATAFVSGLRVLTAYNSTHVIAYPPPELVGRAYEGSGYINLSIWASLNSIGRLFGNYRVRVFGDPLEARAENSSLVIHNPNCFPIHINISFQYAYGVGESWRYTDTSTITLDGFETRVIEPPEGSRFAVAEVSYTVWGGRRWQKIGVRG